MSHPDRKHENGGQTSGKGVVLEGKTTVFIGRSSQDTGDYRLEVHTERGQATRVTGSSYWQSLPAPGGTAGMTNFRKMMCNIGVSA